MIARFEECVFGKRVEIVFAVNKSPQAFQDDSEKGIESFKHSYWAFVINNYSASDGVSKRGCLHIYFQLDGKRLNIAKFSMTLLGFRLAGGVSKSRGDC